MQLIGERVYLGLMVPERQESITIVAGKHGSKHQAAAGTAGAYILNHTQETGVECEMAHRP